MKSRNTPTIEECFLIMEEQKMLPNIKEHSIKVMQVCEIIINNLIKQDNIDRNEILAAALLHDITKTRSLQTNEKHDETAGELLTKLNYPNIAQIVSEHVEIKNFKESGPLLDKEILYYADKRVKHVEIVSIDERINDLLKRYGKNNKIIAIINNSKKLALSIEKKIKKCCSENYEKELLELNGR